MEMKGKHILRVLAIWAGIPAGGFCGLQVADYYDRWSLGGGNGHGQAAEVLGDDALGVLLGAILVPFCIWYLTQPSTVKPAMRTLFIHALVCASMSLLAIFWLLARTLIPTVGVENSHGHTIFAAGAFCVVWLFMAFWLRARSQASLPGWLRRLLLVVSISYSLAVFLFVIC